jgi:hypothetical protein|tara:strand:- start:1 stop:561 length:561 start_codon:yes stop_codon:yes gene_type:complete
MYRLFIDKAEVFECDIKVEGTSLNKSKARLIIETKNYSLLFDGKIDSSGKCSIPIKKLKGLIEENSKGSIRLEVIAEDTYFTPWETTFEVEASKKVVVEVSAQTESEVIAESKVEVTEVKKEIADEDKDHVLNILKLLVKEEINLENLHLKKNKVNKIIATYQKLQPFSEDRTSSIIEGVINGLDK